MWSAPAFLFEDPDSELHAQPADAVLRDAADPSLLLELEGVAARVGPHLPVQGRLILALLLRWQRRGVFALDLEGSVQGSWGIHKAKNPKRRREAILVCPRWPAPRTRLIDALCYDADLEPGERALAEELLAGTVIRDPVGEIRGAAKSTLTKQVNKGLDLLAEALASEGWLLVKLVPTEAWKEVKEGEAPAAKRSAHRFYALVERHLVLPEEEAEVESTPPELPRPPPPPVQPPRAFRWLLPAGAVGIAGLLLGWALLPEGPPADSPLLDDLDDRLETLVDQGDLDGADRVMDAWEADLLRERHGEDLLAQAWLRQGQRLLGRGAPQHCLEAMASAWLVAEHPQLRQRALAGMARARAEVRDWGAVRSLLDQAEPSPEVLVLEAEAAVAGWDLPGAVELLERDHPQDPRLPLLRALVRTHPLDSGLLVAADVDADGADELLHHRHGSWVVGEPGPQWMDASRTLSWEGEPDGEAGVLRLDPGPDLLLLEAGGERGLYRVRDEGLEEGSDHWPSAGGRAHAVATDMDADGRTEVWVGEGARLLRLDADEDGYWRVDPLQSTPVLEALDSEIEGLVAQGEELTLASGTWSGFQLMGLAWQDGTLQPRWRRRVGEVGGLAVQEDPHRVISTASCGKRSLELFPDGGGCPTSQGLFAHTPGQQAEDLHLLRRLPLSPCGAERTSMGPLHHADLDGDGAEDLLVQLEVDTPTGTEPLLWLLSHAGEGGAELLLPHTRLELVTELDGNQGAEVVLWREDLDQRWVLGTGDEVPPAVEPSSKLAKRTSMVRRDSLLLEDTEARRWESAESLARVGLPGEAARGFSELALRLTGTPASPAAALRAAELYLLAGQPDAAIALLEDLILDPGHGATVTQVLAQARQQSMSMVGGNRAPVELALARAKFDGQWRILDPLAVDLGGRSLGVELVGRDGAVSLPLERTDDTVAMRVELELEHLEQGAALEVEAGSLLGVGLRGAGGGGVLEHRAGCHSMETAWLVEGAAQPQRVAIEAVALPAQGRLLCRVEVNGQVVARRSGPLGGPPPEEPLELRITSGPHARSGALVRARVERVALLGLQPERTPSTRLPEWLLGTRRWVVGGEPEEAAELLRRPGAPPEAAVWAAVALAEAGRQEQGAAWLREVVTPPRQASHWAQPAVLGRETLVAADLMRRGVDAHDLFRHAMGDEAWARALLRDARLRASASHRDWAGAEITASRALDALPGARMDEASRDLLSTRFLLLRARSLRGRKHAPRARGDLEEATALATALGAKGLVVEAHRESAMAHAEVGDTGTALEHALAATQLSPTPSVELDRLLSEEPIRELAMDPSWEEVRSLGMWSPPPQGEPWTCLEGMKGDLGRQPIPTDHPHP